MEFDLMNNITANDTFDPDEYYYRSRQNVLDIPMLLFASAGILANSLITYIILRNKPLRTRTNIYLVNICICNSMYLLFSPLIFNLFSAAERIHAYIICFTDEFFFFLC
ncbi:hypothetical protein HHI36_008186 [Cryptolaemus montrouzieri]|uniref:G-protein coupled receptors family 1 profile domain-containing protein n=1 Tax=Cryptolaemus montrouzieri TaxID=559131 RepID=A0ABD2MS82_9CUCU